MDQELSLIKKFSKSIKYYEDLYDIFWKISDGNKIKKEHYNNISIGLFNIPCAGFGDIIVCKTFYDYLKEWYPGSNIKICTTTPEKYKELKIDGDIYKLHSNVEKIECLDYNQLILKKKVKFDIMVAIPIINKSFEINKFKKLIPYSNVFNTFAVSEYNGEFPPYTFPIGVGYDNLGILFNNFKQSKQKLINGPYALVYIQPSPEWGMHSKYCFLSYMEMICKKYRSKHSNFQVIIPEWIMNDILDDNVFKGKLLKVCSSYENILVQGGEKDIIKGKDKNNSRLIFRADILPQPRGVFISLMKESINDILVTGDQSLTDIISCCKGKNVWYQIAPWKKGLAWNLYKELPNKYFKSFQTSCGSLKTLNTKIDWKTFMKNYDFRINGKKRFDSILYSTFLMKNSDNLKNLLNIIEHSRYLETAQKKIDKLKYN